jgi:hypothetical protein
MTDVNTIEKIKKLLRLGASNSGASDAEAESAMSMAAALMAKHAVQVTLDGDDAPEAVRGAPDWKFDEVWHRECAAAAGYLYYCRAIFYGNKGIAFVGRPDNIEACNATLHYLVAEVERLYKANLPKGLDKATRAEYRRTFKFACGRRLAARAWAIMETLRNDDAKAIAATGSKALVVVQSIDTQLAEADDMLKAAGVKTAKNVMRKGGNGTLAGQRAGNTVQLQKQVGSDPWDRYPIEQIQACAKWAGLDDHDLDIWDDENRGEMVRLLKNMGYTKINATNPDWVKPE